jgi:hypothetical protein
MAIRNIIQKAEQEHPSAIKQELDPLARPELALLSGYLDSNFYTNNNPSGFINNKNVVYTSGTQTISGEKTFSASLFVFSGANVVFVNNTGIVSGQWQFSNRPTLNGTGFLLSGEAAQLPETIVYTTGNQIIDGQKIFRGEIRINNLYVTGTETVVNTTNTNVASNYLLLNATGGAIDAGIFIVTGDNLTGIYDSGAVIGYDVPSNRWVFGNTSRNSDLSQLKKIAGINDIENYSGFANNTFVTSTGNNIISGDNTFYSDKYIFSGADIVISGGTFNSNIRPFVNGTGVLLSGEAAAGQNSFIMTLSNNSDTQSAGHNHFGSLIMGFSNNANNRKFPVLEDCVVKKAVWSQAHGTLGNPSQNSTGYFINTTTNVTGIISTTINNTSSSPTNYIATFSPPITISSGDYIVCNLFGPTYASGYPSSVRNSVHLYCYN